LEEATALSYEGDKLVKVDVERAIRIYRDAAALYPWSTSILWKLTHALERTEDWKSTTEVLERAAELKPTYAIFWSKLGYAWIQRADMGERSAYERAIGPLKQCIKNEPGIAECHHLLGRAYEWTGDHRSALDAYMLAVQHEPKRSRFYADLGALYFTLHFQEEAKAVLEEGVRVAIQSAGNTSGHLDIHLMLATIARDQDDRAAFRRALGAAETFVDDRRPLTAFEVGAAYAMAERPNKERAIPLLNRFVMLVCRGARAAQFQEQCEQSSTFLQRFGQ
jgi:tetratricopeptide (TPR) repeat protein